MSNADGGLVLVLATEKAELREQLAEVQEVLIETAVDAGELHARIEQQQPELTKMRYSARRRSVASTL